MELNAELQKGLDQVAKLSPAVRAVIAVFLAALVGAGYYFMFYDTAADQLKGLQAQELELQRKLNEVRSVAANIGEFEEEIQGLEFKLQRVLRQLPNDKEIEVLLTDMSNVGKTSGIEIKSFRRRDEVTHGFYAEVPIELEIEGSYHELARFFDRLAGLPRIVNMGSISMKVERESLNETTLKVSGMATTFRFVEKGGSA